MFQKREQIEHDLEKLLEGEKLIYEICKKDVEKFEKIGTENEDQFKDAFAIVRDTILNWKKKDEISQEVLDKCTHHDENSIHTLLTNYLSKLQECFNKKRSEFLNNANQALEKVTFYQKKFEKIFWDTPDKFESCKETKSITCLDEVLNEYIHEEEYIRNGTTENAENIKIDGTEVRKERNECTEHILGEAKEQAQIIVSDFNTCVTQ